MSEQKNAESVEATGSSDLIQKGPSVNTPGAEGEPKTAVAEFKSAQTTIDPDKYVPRETYEQLEKKLGEQGVEVGDFRKFFNEVSPLLDKLQAQPEIVEAIMAGELESSLAKAVLENKVKIEDATVVASAHEEVKKELGKKEYAQSSPAEIEKLVEKKISELKSSFEGGIKSLEEKRKFENGVNDFVRETADFPEYADRIVGYLEEHPEIYDISVAYEAVKGRALIDKQAKEDKAGAAEAAKNVAANAAGGSSQGGKIIQDVDVIDTLIAKKANPNIF
jgi:hypothetical protein